MLAVDGDDHLILLNLKKCFNLYVLKILKQYETTIRMF